MNFCGDCGSVLWMDWPPMPDMKVLKTGVLDGEKVLEAEPVVPKGEQFVERRPAWLCPVADAVQTEGQSGRKEAEVIYEKVDSEKAKV